MFAKITNTCFGGRYGKDYSILESRLKSNGKKETTIRGLYRV